MRPTPCRKTTVNTGKLNLIFFIAICCFTLSGCSPLHILNEMTPRSGFVQIKDTAYGELRRQRLDIYRPAAQTDKAPVVIFFHGGAWKSGDKNLYLYIGEALTALGFVAVLPDYRLYPEIKFPVFVDDAAAAVAWVQQNIGTYQGDPQNIILMGHSAGAHIVAMLTLDERFLRNAGAQPPQGMIGMSGMYNFLPLLSDYFGDIFGPPERYPLSQPVNYIDGSEPPVLLLHGYKDNRVPPLSSQELEARLLGNGGCAKTVIYPELDHATMTWSLSVPYRKTEVMTEIRNFVRDSLECAGRDERFIASGPKP